MEEIKQPMSKPNLSPVEYARAHPRSFRAAIRAYCWTCEGADADPCVNWRIGNCEITDCPLWNFRPYQQNFGKPKPPGLWTESEREAKNQANGCTISGKSEAV